MACRNSNRKVASIHPIPRCAQKFNTLRQRRFLHKDNRGGWACRTIYNVYRVDWLNIIFLSPDKYVHTYIIIQHELQSYSSCYCHYHYHYKYHSSWQYVLHVIVQLRNEWCHPFMIMIRLHMSVPLL